MSSRARPHLALLISGGGRTMVNLAERIEAGTLDAQIAIVISSQADAAGIARAEALGLPVVAVERRRFGSADAFSEAVWDRIRPLDVDLVCLAGFLCLLHIPQAFAGRVLNIHPALLPKFGGKGMYGQRVHEAVLAAGDTESGCTVHVANNEYDSGPIVHQRRCPVLPEDTPETLAARVFEQELIAYPEAIERVWEAMGRGCWEPGHDGPGTRQARGAGRSS